MVIWIGTETGIYIYNAITETAVKIEKNSADKYAIYMPDISCCKTGVFISGYAHFAMAKQV